ncbi:hypothetical protein MNAN1_002675 [Malassezia nana]|uniref:Uncharacterized protein n=1 Tax=Malassezia nana TaxID=180528 RepID=A0AAF0EN53_9BASI|nr:hypothetical protein MNAN1_002675 [Malassezia nana]
MLPEAIAVLRRAYGLLFACLPEAPLCPLLCALLCELTEAHHVRAFRIRTLLSLYKATHHDALYTLLDTYALFQPALLLPIDEPTPKDSSRTALPIASWAHALPTLVLPDTVPGLASFHVRSRVPRLLRHALALSPALEADDGHSVGTRLAASAGRLLAAHHIRCRGKGAALSNLPPFDPGACALLDALYLHVAQLQYVPRALRPLLVHVVQSMGQDALAHLTQAPGLTAWERRWRPVIRRLVQFCAWLPPCSWDELFGSLFRPLCHMATMDGVSDLFSASVLHAMVRLLEHWADVGAPDTPKLIACAIEFQEALVLSGDPSLPVYAAMLELLGALAHAHRAQATSLFPFPFVQLATPPSLAGSVATLDRACEHVLYMRTHVLNTPNSALQARVVDDMALAFADMIWSGRAFGQFLQRGITVDDVMVCDRSAVAVWKQACDEQRIVPFVLVASLSHGALLAPLFEQFCHTALLPGWDIRAPITPSALRGARGPGGLPAHVQYPDIRRQFLHWLATSGAPHIEALLQALVPSLQGG